MSNHAITVRVTLADSNFARAGTGKAATTASSTSSGRDAALAAAAKYFSRPQDKIAIALTQKGDQCLRLPEFYLATPLRGQVQSAGKVLKLTKSRRAP